MTFQAVRAHFGLATPRNRSSKSVLSRIISLCSNFGCQ